MTNVADKACLLIEIGTEELPPLALPKLSNAFEASIRASLEAAKLNFGDVVSFAAPRRLALQVFDLDQAQDDQTIERRGPAKQAAFDADGNPTKAGLGFARSCGVELNDLEVRETPKGSWLFYQGIQQGAQTASLLGGFIETALNSLPIPKRMRWGDSEVSFVRPVHWAVVMLDDSVVDCDVLGLPTGRITHGHRFHAPDALELDHAANYERILESTAFVVPSFAKRRDRIEAAVDAAAAKLGGKPLGDDELIAEITALVEWPVAIAGEFEQRFLEVPHEALIYTMKKNQKYVPVADADGALLPAFITIANIDSPQPEVIKSGNERVVRPRLADAAFFWEQDCRSRLETRFEKLATIVFQDQLGTLADKTERVSAIAAELGQRLDLNSQTVTRIARLSRCDLVTETVFEFPEMQGVMGRYLAARDGEGETIAQALDDFYKPRFSGDTLPTSLEASCVALADKLDTICGIFATGQLPTGDKDPFGLRRAALGALRILEERNIATELRELISFSVARQPGVGDAGALVDSVLDFVFERLKGVMAEQGFSAEQFAAVFATGTTSVTDFRQRLGAVQSFSSQPEAQSLAAANKRIRNLLKRAEATIPAQLDASITLEPAEENLVAALDAANSDVQPALEARDYNAVLSRLADLRPAVDDFFDQIMVMADDPSVRLNRLALLASVKNLFASVADISELG